MYKQVYHYYYYYYYINLLFLPRHQFWQYLLEILLLRSWGKKSARQNIIHTCSRDVTPADIQHRDIITPGENRVDTHVLTNAPVVRMSSAVWDVMRSAKKEDDTKGSKQKCNEYISGVLLWWAWVQRMRWVVVRGEAPHILDHFRLRSPWNVRLKCKVRWVWRYKATSVVRREREREREKDRHNWSWSTVYILSFFTLQGMSLLGKGTRSVCGFSFVPGDKNKQSKKKRKTHTHMYI